MARLAFPFSYQAFTRYVRDGCECLQEVDGEHINEQKLYDIMMQYLEAKPPYDHIYRREKFAPVEFRRRGPGAPKRIDIIRQHRRESEDGTINLILEAKLMVDDNRKWVREIVSDILRVASIQSRTNKKTRRFVLVVGQERCWDQVLSQLDGLLSQMCQTSRSRWNLFRRYICEKKRPTPLNDDWRKRAEAAIEDYLVPVLPEAVDLQLVGCSVTGRGPNEDPKAGMTARLWQVYPRGWPVSRSTPKHHETTQALEPAPVPVSVPQSE